MCFYIGETAEYIKTIWSDPKIKETFENRNNLSIVDSCSFFLNDIYRIGGYNEETKKWDDYIPTKEDILLARTPTTGISDEEFVAGNRRFKLVDVGGQRSERKKWFNLFNIVSAVPRI